MVSYSDVSTKAARQAEGVESCGNDHKLNKYDYNISDLFSPFVPHTLHVRHEKTATESEFSLEGYASLSLKRHDMEVWTNNELLKMSERFLRAWHYFTSWIAYKNRHNISFL